MSEAEPTRNFAIEIDAMLPGIAAAVGEKLKQRAIEAAGYECQQAVALEVRKYIEERILPDVRDELVEHEAELRAAFVSAVLEACSVAMKKIVEQATQKMASYEGDKLVREVVTAIFPRY